MSIFKRKNIRETNILFSYLLQQYKIKYYNNKKIPITIPYKHYKNTIRSY